ncbi:PucR family transcriptional regulator [Thermaerobacter subterraneus]|uniref:Transcriptional regulator, PurR family n=1 Tax=Thermaerobacter subterraneus DSM 13965 TaxID=867903 RepID=K6QF74_9FIRM|nr:PucR family transcriptional regulator ligand-binding domain-containing protein [Thermaerobacter subterraneus]EKP95611.1 transcriptional regulator, PurR family [Thermaerobacter subterraneus DSM 13965]
MTGCAGGGPAPGGAADAVTLAEVLRLEPLREIRVLAGNGSLHRPVRLVNVIEVPDIVDWVLEGELLLTTGFTFRDDPGHLAALVPGLAAKGAAGLGIKPRRYMAEVPGEAIRQAEECGLPLLEIPYHLSFSEVIGPVMQAIAHRQAAATLAADGLQRELLDLVLRGASLDDLCAVVARHLARPVWIEDAAGALVSQAVPGLPGPPPALQEGGTPATVTPDPAAGLQRGPAWRVPVASGDRFFGTLCAASPGRPPLAVEAGLLERGAAILALQWGKQAAVVEVQRRFRTEFLDRLLSGDLPHPAELAERCRALGWDLNRPHTVVVFGPLAPSGPGPAAGRQDAAAGQPARGSAGSSPRDEPGPDRELQPLLRAAEMVLSMEGGEPVAGIRDGLVVALIPGDPAGPAGRHRILTVAKAVLRSYASSTGTARGSRGPLPSGHGPAAGIPPATSAAPGPDGRRPVRDGGPAGALGGGSPASWGDGTAVAAAGVGRVAPGPAALARSYREARTALQAVRATAAHRDTRAEGTGITGRAGITGQAGITGRPAAGVPGRSSRRAPAGLPGGSPGRGSGRTPEPVQFFAELGILRLLHHQPREELAGFVADYLGALLAYDRRHDGKLLETLEAYFRYGGNMKRMAQALYTHYNTVAYRLGRIRQITGLDLKDPDQLLSLQVALRALPLLDGGPAWEGPPREPRDAAAGGPGPGRPSLGRSGQEGP